MTRIMFPVKIVIGCATAIALLTSFAPKHATDICSKKRTIVRFAKNGEQKIDVLIKTPDEKTVEFYLFRASGELVKKINTTSKATLSITRPDNGQYIYQCFEKDEQLVCGTLSIASKEIDFD